MRRRSRELLADGLITAGAAGVVVSLFLTWSHQFSATFLAEWDGSDVLRGVPRDPTAWQVYSVADAVLAALAALLVAVALVGNRAARLCALVAAGGGLAFAVHALSVPPTNGAYIPAPGLNVPAYVPNAPAAGPGEAVAVVALAVAIVGLSLSFTAD